MPRERKGVTMRPDGSNAGRSNKGLTDPARARNADLMYKAANLRAGGATFAQIGTTLGIDRTWAQTLVWRALEEVKYESADVMRTQEGARLDRLQMGLWPAATSGDPRAVLAVLRIMERRARLFGLDAPTRVEVGPEPAEHDDVDAALHTILGTLADADTG